MANKNIEPSIKSNAHKNRVLKAEHDVKLAYKLKELNPTIHVN